MTFDFDWLLNLFGAKMIVFWLIRLDEIQSIIDE